MLKPKSAKDVVLAYLILFVKIKGSIIDINLILLKGLIIGNIEERKPMIFKLSKPHPVFIRFIRILF